MTLPCKSAAPGGASAVSPTVLVVDSEPAVLSLARRAFERLGLLVAEASSAEQAVEIVSREKDVIRAVLADPSLPGISDADWINRIRSKEPGLPVVFWSGESPGNEFLDRITTDPKAEFLPKPCRAIKLTATVCSLIPLQPEPDGRW